MTTHVTPQLDIHDMVEELTRTHTHREPYVVRSGATVWTRGHVTTVPALILQLLAATPAGSGEQAGSVAHSRPAAPTDPIDTIMLVDDEAERWLLRLGHNAPGDAFDPNTQRPVPGSGTIARIRALHGLHASAPHCGRDRGHRDDNGAWCCYRHRIEHDVRRWWHQARIITGWDSPSWRPDSTCPVCEQRRSLRINLTMRAGFCVECRTIWSAEEIGLLAEHIRTENGDTLGDTGT